MTWAIGWAPIGAVVGAVIYTVIPGAPFGIGAVIARNAAMFGILGFLGGTMCASVLRLTEGRSRFDALSLPRFSTWGALGGLLLGGSAVALGLWGAGAGLIGAGMVVAATALGASSSAASLVLARRADLPVLESGEEDVSLEAVDGPNLLVDG